MYLANISNSTLTKSFTLRFFRFVNSSECGIIFKLKFLPLTLDIVKETPFIDIDAFLLKTSSLTFCN